MLKKLIHIIFLPCSEATMLMEKRNAENISPKENRKLSLHLAICKWCRAYKEKLEMLDRMLERKLFNEDQVEINESDIQYVKQKALKNLDIS
jgi:predicted anti-sigma-YlaC factor YlaD